MALSSRLTLVLLLITSFWSPLSHASENSNENAALEPSSVDLEAVDPEKDLQKIRISPEFTLGFPQPLMLGVELSRESNPEWRVYLDGGYFQYPLKIQTRGGSEYSVETGVRFSPLNNWFSMALGMGYRKIQAYVNTSAFTIDGATIVTDGVANLSTFYISPMLESRIHLSQKIDLMFGLGVQIPLIASGVMTLQNTNNSTNSSNSSILAIDQGDSTTRIAQLVLPRVTLLRLVWHFD